LINYRLVLRVLVTAANVPEREGGKEVLKQVDQMGQSVWSLFLVWVDGGGVRQSFRTMGDGYVTLGCDGCVATGTGFHALFYSKSALVVERTFAQLVSQIK